MFLQPFQSVYSSAVSPRKSHDSRPMRSWAQVLGWGLLLLLEIAVAGAQPLRAGADKDTNVIIITIDTLRADHLGSYGYKQIATPEIDALARLGVRFSQAYTPVPITLPAHTALFTGSFPMATGMHDFSGNKVSPGAITLASVLRDRGYTTAAFLGSAVLDSRFGLNQGFETYFDHFQFSRLDETNVDEMKRRGDLVVDEALRWLRLNPKQPFLLWVHLYDPHHPYAPPEPYTTRYSARPYDGEIAFADSQVGRLLSYLRDRRLDAGSIVVLAGDHGEGLGEHGEKRHGFFIYNSTLHVPLIVKVPGFSARVVQDEVSLVDVMPTVLQTLNIPIPPSVQGRSLLGLVLGRPRAGQSQLYSETYLPLLHFRWSQLRCIQSGRLKYIDAPHPELYDLRSDPHELKNVYDTQNSIAHELHDRLFALLRRYTSATGASAQQKELADPALFERLRSLGYVAVSAGTFADVGGKQLADPKDRIHVAELISEGMEDGQRGRYEDSLRKLEEAEKTEPSLMTIQYLMALDYYRLKDYRRASERFASTLKLDPKFALALYYQGLTLVQLNDLDGAAASFERALDIDPTNFSAAYNLGAIDLKKSRVEEGERLFQRAIVINQDYALAHEALGELYLYQKRVDDAVRELERATALAPGMRKAHEHLAEAYEAKGLHEQAQRELDRARVR